MRMNAVYRFGACSVVGLVASLGVMPAIAGDSDASVQGQILDAESQAPVFPAEVVLVGTRVRATTDPGGRFALSGVPPGTHTLRATRTGYEPLVRKDVRVEPGQAVDLPLQMRRILNLLEEITVTPGAFSFMEKGSSTRQTMSREDIESVPQLGEDLFRAVNRLPGLSSGDYSAHFSIRGGRQDETLILLDGLELYEPYHLKDFNEGAISIIDTQTIDSVELLTGGFPAQYGNKRSGVFNIASRTPGTDHAQFSAGLSFMNARATGSGPLWDGKGSWLVSARSGYMDLVFGLINQNDLPSPRYHDVFAKLQRSLGTGNALTFHVLHAGDRYTFDAPATTGFLDSLRTREEARNHYGNSYVWTTWDSALGARTTLHTQLSAGLVTRSRDGNEHYVDIVKPLYSLTNSRDYSILGAKQDWTFRVSDSSVLSWGIDARRLHIMDDFTSVVGQNPDDPTLDDTGLYPLTTNTRFEQSGRRLGAYLSQRWRVAHPLTLEIGGRYDGASYTGDRDLSPRTGAALDLGHSRTLRLGWGHYRQIQGIEEVAVLNDSGRYFASELSKQWTAGLEQAFADGSLLRVEGYLKHGSDLRPVYRNWKNAPDVFPETNEDRILVFPRKSTARGIELYFTRDVSRRLALKASYALSVSEEEVDRIDNVNSAIPIPYDTKHPTPQDQRHAANVDFTYRLSSWSINGSLAFHSGWPGTLEELVPVTNEEGNPDSAVRPVKLYGTRLPSYFRFDVRATKKWSRWHFFVELVNLTNHSNVFGYDYFRSLDSMGNTVLTRDNEKWFTILPSVGVTWSSGF